MESEYFYWLCRAHGLIAVDFRLFIRAQCEQFGGRNCYVFSCLWFRSSLIYINNCPTRCNTKQSIYYSASSFYMFRVSTTPIIRNTQKCNYSLRYWSYFLYSYLLPTWPSLATLEGGSWPVPEAVSTVLFTPDDGCGWHQKRVEWTCVIINRLLCVASRWTIINMSLCVC